MIQFDKFLSKCSKGIYAAGFTFIFCLASLGVFGQPVYEGDVFLYSQAEVNAWSPAYTSIHGILRFEGADITDLTPLSNISEVQNGLYIINNTALTTLAGLENIATLPELVISGNPSLTTLTGLDGLSSVVGLSIGENDELASLEGLNNVTILNGYVGIGGNDVLNSLTALSNVGSLYALGIVNNDALTNLNGLEGIINVSEFMGIHDNDALLNLDGLDGLTYVGGQFSIINNASLINLNGLNNLSKLGNSLHIEQNNSLINLDGLNSLDTISDYLEIWNCNALTSLSGLENLDFTIEVSLRVNASLQNLVGLTSLTHLGALLVSECNSLTSLTGLTSLESIYFFNIQSNPALTSITNLPANLDIAYLNITYNTALVSLSGLNILTHLNGLDITGNILLPTLDGLENLNSIDFGLTVTQNYSLSNCCAIYDLINTEGAVGVSIHISQNATGCDSPTEVCDLDGDLDDDGYTPGQGDCDDANMLISPGVQEVCGNGIDDDCDGATDEQFTQIVITEESIHHVSCPYVADGEININVTGGVGPYSYQWYYGMTSEDVTGLSAGIHSVTITDALQRCTTKSFLITQPEEMILTYTINNVKCYGESNGSATVHVDGGVSNYTYLWSNGTTTKKINNVSAGFYWLIVTDATGCSAYGGAYIYEPGPLFVSNVEIYPTGNTYTLIVNPYEGTAPYKYRRSKTNGGWTPWQSSNVFNNVPAGNYVIQLKDNNNCDTSYSVAVPGSSQHPLPEVAEVINPLAGEQTFVEIKALESESEKTISENGMNSHELLLYPNPASDEITIVHASSVGKPVQITIINNLGVVLLRQKIDAMPKAGIKIDLSDFTNGLYFLNLQSGEGKSETKYFVKVE